MSAQTVSTCVVCQAVTDAFLCGDARRETGCLGLLIQRLGDCAWLAEQLDTTLARQDKVSAGSVGFVTGNAEKPLPLNLSASDASLDLRDKLCSWVRCLWEDNGVPDEDGWVGPADIDPTITSTSRWLMRHPSWIAFHPAADEIYYELTSVIQTAFRVIDIPKDTRIFLGKCGFEMDGEWCKHELYARPRTPEVTCSVCGSEWVVEERLTFLRSIAEDEVLEIPALSRLLASLGFADVTEKAIRSKAQSGAIKAVERQAHGRSAFRVGDVMDVFMAADQPVAA